MEALFSPARLGAVHAANRIAMAPLTRSRAGALDGVPSPHAAEYYAQRSKAGLIVTEASQIRADGQGYVRTPGIFTQSQADGWRIVTDRVHASGGKIALQLWHVGRIAHADNVPAPGFVPVGPSAIAAAGAIHTPRGMQAFQTPHALAATEISALVKDFAAAARLAISAGFDAVELHAANGYLVDQFMNSSTNRRTDRYGGPAGHRLRLLEEICVALADAVGADRVGVRLSPFGTFNDVADEDPHALYEGMLAVLDPLRLAYLHLIRPEVSGDRTARNGAQEDVVAFARACTSTKLIAAGGFDAEEAERAIASGLVDMVAFGRLFISNPDLPDRFRHSAPLATHDRETLYSEGEVGYVDYPTLEGAALSGIVSHGNRG